MPLIATAAKRAHSQTSPADNRQIRERTRASVGHHAANPGRIDQRLRELDQEWDIERWLEVNSSALSLAGLALGIFHSRKWLLLPAIVQTFFLQHALQGWCPPLPLFRKAGVRTKEEIAAERYALRALRGDFRQVDRESDPAAAADEAFEAARP